MLEYLRRTIDGTLAAGATTYMRYPTAISKTLGMRVVAAGHGTATVEIAADPDLHGNQQGTVHGGLICELADAAIGTAHSTLCGEGESFTTVELKMSFFRPVWRSVLRASARPIHPGRTITHYLCEVVRDDGKVAATAMSTVMTLRGAAATGR